MVEDVDGDGVVTWKDQHLALAAEESAASARLAADLDATNALARDAMRNRLAKRKAQRASRRSSLSAV